MQSKTVTFGYSINRNDEVVVSTTWEGKKAFPDRYGMQPKAGEEWEVESVKPNPKNTVYFLKLKCQIIDTFSDVEKMLFSRGELELQQKILFGKTLHSWAIWYANTYPGIYSIEIYSKALLTRLIDSHPVEWWGSALVGKREEWQKFFSLASNTELFQFPTEDAVKEAIIRLVKDYKPPCHSDNDDSSYPGFGFGALARENNEW